MDTMWKNMSMCARYAATVSGVMLSLFLMLMDAPHSTARSNMRMLSKTT